jgi:tRNA(Ile2) C34 agmatinyltransferase TiaS
MTTLIVLIIFFVLVLTIAYIADGPRCPKCGKKLEDWSSNKRYCPDDTCGYIE